MPKVWKSRREPAETFDGPSLTAKDVTATPVDVPSREEIAMLRSHLGLSQSVFAQVLNVSPETIRGWEQGKRTPDGASLRLLELAGRHPEWVLETLRTFSELEPGQKVRRK